MKKEPGCIVSTSMFVLKKRFVHSKVEDYAKRVSRQRDCMRDGNGILFFSFFRKRKDRMYSPPDSYRDSGHAQIL
ncbi:hypothetical protein D3C84_496580 [compost metagenome]